MSEWKVSNDGSCGALLQNFDVILVVTLMLDQTLRIMIKCVSRQFRSGFTV